MGKTPAVKVPPAARQARAVQRDRGFLRAVLRRDLETAGRLANAPIEAEDARVSHQWGPRRKLVEAPLSSEPLECAQDRALFNLALRPKHT